VAVDGNEAISAFAALARRYCRWAEAAPGEPRAEILLARQLLAALQYARLMLPESAVGGDHETSAVPHQHWQAIRQRFGVLPIDEYSEVYDPFSDEPAVTASVADSLADIDRDLRQGLELYDAGALSEAAWHWRVLHGVHWGRQLLGAQRAIHAWLTRHE
jgi:hypothetical protein